MFLSSWLLSHQQQMNGDTVVCFPASVTDTSRFFFSDTDERFMTWHHVMRTCQLTWWMLIRLPAMSKMVSPQKTA